ncbi:MAG: ABC transporter ATP-binding protein [Clostridiaceae bacterium]|nr:ABC transporter ATP-binding protein [Clostridiaceae bacterium]
MDYFFSTKQLTVGYNGTPLIRDIEIRLQKGRILTLIGPNGAGKSTILMSITRQLKSIAGTIYIGDRSIEEMTNRDLSHHLSVVLTERLRTELMTCEEIVETGRYPYTGMLGILSAADKAAVREAMKLVNVADLKDRDFMCISDGQRQRVLLARAICQQPEILVLDEPTSYLDIRYELELLDILRDMAEERGITIILSLHNLSLAQRVSDDVMCVKGETISHYGSAEEIFQRNLIHELYGLTDGSYNPVFGSVEMKRPPGTPHVFVIAGGGTGIEAYRTLQKKRIPFITGVLHENDIDYQVAHDIASCVISEHGFCPITDSSYQQALEKLHTCDTVVNCLVEYGEINARNRELFEQARLLGCKVVENVATL